MKTERAWGWPIALDLFLAGLGGGIMIVSAVADLFFGTGNLFLPASFAATVLLAIGASLLVFELGRPFQFLRVFSRQKAIMTVGAYMLSLLIAVSFAYGTFLFSFLPWHAIEWLRQVVAAIGLLLGVGVVVYTGVLPASMKSRPFWHGPALPVLFMVSAISNGIAVQYLLVHVLSSGSDVACCGKPLNRRQYRLTRGGTHRPVYLCSDHACLSRPARRAGCERLVERSSEIGFLGRAGCDWTDCSAGTVCRRH